jgi:hypothetical protein
MPRPSIHRLSQRTIDSFETGQDRFLDLRLEARLSQKSRTPGRLIGFPVGGRWDKLERRYVGPGESSRVISLEDNQLELASVWFDWLHAYVTDDWRAYERRHGERPFSMWGVGGRRKGKSFFGIQSVALFSVAVAGSFPWIVSETEDDFQEEAELMRYWRRFLPAEWYEVNERELYIQVINGTRVMLKSGHNPENTKKGESSYVFVNEAQKMAQAVYDNCRGAISDSGSVVTVAANPPKTAKGYWVQDMVRKLRRGDVQGYLKEFTEESPHVVGASLDAMAKEMSRRDYQIEREGRFMARTDMVMHAFEDGERGNVQPVPQLGEITGAFLKRKLGRPFACIVGADFQLAPHMAAVVERFYADPDDPNDALSWTVDEVVVEQGDENDLIDALEGRLGLVGADVAVIADASGEWQQGDRKRGQMTGRGSYDMFRARGWKHLFKPDERSERNPLILERVAVGNARLRTADDRRHAFIAPGCVLTAEAISKWPNGREGFPSRRSQYSHIGDAWTYPKYRLWPRRHEAKGKPRIELINLRQRDDAAF